MQKGNIDYFTTTQKMLIKENIENPMLKLEDSLNKTINLESKQNKTTGTSMINTTFSQLGIW
jgi:hypothetical protein